MKRFVFLGTICTSLLLGAGCSQQGPSSTPGSGGETSSSGGATGSGGSVSSSGGTTGSGGVTSTGGSSSSGGGTATGGKMGSGGTTSSGGATATGGATASTGGTVGTGGTTASGGATTTASGGATATGGVTGSGGATGSGGTTGSGGSSGGVTVADVVPDLAGFYWEGTCMGTGDPGGRNCWFHDNNITTCPTGATYDKQGIIRDKVINVKGTTGQKYTVNFEVRGVIGTRCYQNGKRASTASASDTGYNNWWYAGGTQYNDSWWNTYELHVSPSTGDASGDVYYFNGSDNPGGSYCEKEATYLVKYNASFKVVGGGTLTFRIHDSNCKGQQNCGPNTDNTTPCVPRTVDMSGQTPQPPASFMQPPTNVISSTWYPQWMWITATSVTSP